MSDRVRCGIFFCGPAMRYAEVERVPSGPGLLRLGSCDFDFDAERALLEGNTRRLDTVREAVGDVFAGSRSTEFGVVLSPGSVISFFSPVSDRIPEAEKKRQLESETVLIGGSSAPLSVVAEPVVEDSRVDTDPTTWYHIAAVPTSVRKSVASIVDSFPEARTRLRSAMQAAARVAELVDEAEADGGESSGTAVIGCFSDATEISILVNGEWRFGATTGSTLPADVAYAVLDLARQVGIAADRLRSTYLYGEVVEETLVAALGTASSSDPAWLNPLELVRSDPGEIRSNFDPERYVLSIGAAL